MNATEGRVAVVGMRGGSPYRVTTETLRDALDLVLDQVVDGGMTARGTC